MEKMIVQYLRDKYDNTRKGVVVGVANEGRWSIGVSVANTAAGDRFNPSLGLRMAHGRAVKLLAEVQNNVSTFDAIEAGFAKVKENLEKAIVEATTEEERDQLQAELDGYQGKTIKPYVDICLAVPVGVYDQVEEFYERAQKYFKDKTQACHIEPDAGTGNTEKIVQQLTSLFETEKERAQRESAPPSARGQYTMPITAQEVINMQHLAKALEGINLGTDKHKGVGPQNKIVTRVGKP